MVIEHESQTQGLRVAAKLAEYLEGSIQQNRVLWLRDILNTAARMERVRLCRVILKV